MTREEAIRILDPETTGEALAEIEYYNGFSGNTAAVQAVSDACILAISALREQEERRWIPVTERLPEQGERVLATDGGFVGELYVNSRGQWKRYNVNDHSLLMALDILWWMPMPQPPKEVPENETL